MTQTYGLLLIRSSRTTRVVDVCGPTYTERDLPTPKSIFGTEHVFLRSRFASENNPSLAQQRNSPGTLYFN